MKILSNLRSKITMAAGLALLLVLCAQNTRVSFGQSGWSTPIAISPSGFFSWFPDVLADPYGRVHSVWASGDTGFDTVVYTYSEDGVKWQTPNDVFAIARQGENSAATRPTLLFDAKARLNITFDDGMAVHYSRVNVANAPSAKAWSAKLPMSGSQTSYFSRLAVDDQNIFHYLYTMNTPSDACNNCYHLYYRQSSDDGRTWSTPVDLVQDGTGAVKPQILLEKGNHIHVVWETGQGGGLGQLSNPTSVTYAASSDGGKTWSSPVNLSKSSADMGKNIAIGQDKQGNLIVAWLAMPANVIMYQVSVNGGKNWGAPSAIPGVWGPAAVYLTNLDDYQFASDSSGNLHLVAVGSLNPTQQTLNIFNLVWDGVRWTKVDVIAAYKGDVPEWPRVSIGLGNQMNVVWFVRDEANIWQSDKGHYRVWYSRGLVDAKAIDPLVMPTAEPALSVAPSPRANPSSTPKKVATAVSTSVPNPDATPISPGRVPQSETDFVLILALTLVPSLLLIAGAVIYIVSRKR